MPLRAYLVTQHRLHDPLTKMDVPVPSRIRGTVVHDTTDNHTADAFEDKHLRDHVVKRVHSLRDKSNKEGNVFELPTHTTNAQSGYTWRKLDASKAKVPADGLYDAQQLANRLLAFYSGFASPEDADNLMSSGTPATPSEDTSMTPADEDDSDDLDIGEDTSLLDLGGKVAATPDRAMQSAEFASRASQSHASSVASGSDTIPPQGEWRIINGKHIFLKPGDDTGASKAASPSPAEPATAPSPDGLGAVDTTDHRVGKSMKPLPLDQHWNNVGQQSALTDGSGKVIEGPSSLMGKNVGDIPEFVSKKVTPAASISAADAKKPHWAQLSDGTHVLLSKDNNDVVRTQRMVAAKGQNSSPAALIGKTEEELKNAGNGVAGHFPAGHLPAMVKWATKQGEVITSRAGDKAAPESALSLAGRGDSEDHVVPWTGSKAKSPVTKPHWAETSQGEFVHLGGPKGTSVDDHYSPSGMGAPIRSADDLKKRNAKILYHYEPGYTPFTKPGEKEEAPQQEVKSVAPAAATTAPVTVPPVAEAEKVEAPAESKSESAASDKADKADDKKEASADKKETPADKKESSTDEEDDLDLEDEEGATAAEKNKPGTQQGGEMYGRWAKRVDPIGFPDDDRYTNGREDGTNDDSAPTPYPGVAPTARLSTAPEMNAENDGNYAGVLDHAIVPKASKAAILKSRLFSKNQLPMENVHIQYQAVANKILDHMQKELPDTDWQSIITAFKPGNYKVPSTQEGAAKALVKTLTTNWENSSSKPACFATIMAADDVFGIHSWNRRPGYLAERTSSSQQRYARDSYADRWDKGKDLYDHPVIKKVLQSFVRAQYKETQAFLKQHGIKYLVAHRGVTSKVGQQFSPSSHIDNRIDTAFERNKTATGKSRDWSEGGITNVESSPVSAWSVGSGRAEQFAGSSNGKQRGIALTAAIPASRIFSTFQTGMGSNIQREVLVVGGPNQQVSWGAGRTGKLAGAEARKIMMKHDYKGTMGVSPPPSGSGTKSIYGELMLGYKSEDGAPAGTLHVDSEERNAHWLHPGSDVSSSSSSSSASSSEDTPEWRTIHGNHVMISKDGTILDGPPELKNKNVSDLGEPQNAGDQTRDNPTSVADASAQKAADNAGHISPNAATHNAPAVEPGASIKAGQEHQTKVSPQLPSDPGPVTPQKRREPFSTHAHWASTQKNELVKLGSGEHADTVIDAENKSHIGKSTLDLAKANNAVEGHYHPSHNPSTGEIKSAASAVSPKAEYATQLAPHWAKTTQGHFVKIGGPGNDYVSQSTSQGYLGHHVDALTNKFNDPIKAHYMPSFTPAQGTVFTHDPDAKVLASKPSETKATPTIDAVLNSTYSKLYPGTQSFSSALSDKYNDEDDSDFDPYADFDDEDMLEDEVPEGKPLQVTKSGAASMIKNPSSTPIPPLNLALASVAEPAQHVSEDDSYNVPEDGSGDHYAKASSYPIVPKADAEIRNRSQSFADGEMAGNGANEGGLDPTKAIARRMKAMVSSEDATAALKAIGGKPDARNPQAQFADLLSTTWGADSTFGNLPIALKMSAADIFKIPGWDTKPAHVSAYDWNQGKRLMDNPSFKRTMDGFVKSMYDNTQSYLKKKGLSHVMMFRGFNSNDAAPHLVPHILQGNESAMKSKKAYWATSGVSHASTDPVSSFTTDPDVGFNFSGEPFDDQAPAMLYGAVPRQRILSTHLTGLGMPHEHEATVLDGPQQYNWGAGNDSFPIEQELKKMASSTNYNGVHGLVGNDQSQISGAGSKASVPGMIPLNYPNTVLSGKSETAPNYSSVAHLDTTSRNANWIKLAWPYTFDADQFLSSVLHIDPQHYTHSTVQTRLDNFIRTAIANHMPQRLRSQLQTLGYTVSGNTDRSTGGKSSTYALPNFTEDATKENLPSFPPSLEDDPGLITELPAINAYSSHRHWVKLSDQCFARLGDGLLAETIIDAQVAGYLGVTLQSLGAKHINITDHFHPSFNPWLNQPETYGDPTEIEGGMPIPSQGPSPQPTPFEEGINWIYMSDGSTVQVGSGTKEQQIVDSSNTAHIGQHLSALQNNSIVPSMYYHPRYDLNEDAFREAPEDTIESAPTDSQETE